MPENDNQLTASAVERFEKIYDATYHKLYGFVLRHVWSEATTKDVLQECYIRLWEKMTTLKDDEKVLPMLRTIALNITIDNVRKKARELDRAKVYQESQALTTTADEGLYFQEVMNKYREAVSALPPQQRKVFQLTHEEGLNYRDVSEELQISPHTIKRHMNEALKSLRSSLSPEMLSLVVLLLDAHKKFPF